MKAWHGLLGVASLVAVGVAYGPLLREFGADLWEKPHYQHFPFVLLAAVLLFAQRFGERESQSTGRPWLAYVAYVIAWALLIPAFLAPSPLLAAVSFIVLLGGVGLAASRAAASRFPIGPWLLMWLVIPPPLGSDRRLMTTLQHVSSRLSSYALDLLGVNHLMDGNALVLPDKQLFVDEACSGIISAISIVACAAMYGVWRRRGGVHIVLLMVLAAGWATLLNVVRIISIALAWDRSGLDWSEGVAHTVLGLVIFALSLAVLIANDWLLKAALAAIGPRWEQITAEPLKLGASLVGLWDRFATTDPNASVPDRGRRLWKPAVFAGALGLVPTLASAGVGVAQLISEQEYLERGARIEPAALTERLMRGVMPRQVGDLRLVGFEFEDRTAASQFGEYSVVFEYADPDGRSYLASCDYPFEGWHELAICYTGIGWRMDARDRTEATTPAGEAFQYSRMDLTKPDGRAALVLYGACGMDGVAVPPKRFDLVGRVRDAFTRNSTAAIHRQVFQFQVLLERVDSITDDDRASAALLLETARDSFTGASRSAVAEGA